MLQLSVHSTQQTVKSEFGVDSMQCTVNSKVSTAVDSTQQK